MKNMAIKYKLEMLFIGELTSETAIVSEFHIESSIHESLGECENIIHSHKNKPDNFVYCFYVTEYDDIENIPLREYFYEFDGVLSDKEIYIDKEKSLEIFKNLSVPRRFSNGSLVHFIYKDKIYQGIVHEHYWMVNGKPKTYDEINIDGLEGPESYTILALEHQDGLSVFHVNRMEIVMDIPYEDYGHKLMDLYRPIRDYLDLEGYPKEETELESFE